MHQYFLQFNCLHMASLLSFSFDFDKGIISQQSTNYQTIHSIEEIIIKKEKEPITDNVKGMILTMTFILGPYCSLMHWYPFLKWHYKSFSSFSVLTVGENSSEEKGATYAVYTALFFLKCFRNLYGLLGANETSDKTYTLNRLSYFGSNLFKEFFKNIFAIWE